MAFNPNKYTINQKYIKKGNARSGAKISKVQFLVAHDIGNGGSTAENNYRYFNNHQPSASAHTFIDDTQILEIVPIDEKAWHVRYDVPADNKTFGDDANDCAIGTELCWGPKLDFDAAYDRYVWYHAYLCHKFGLDPKTDITSHAALDPARRTDPHTALNKNGKTYAEFIEDVCKELKGSERVVTSQPVSGLVVGGTATVKKSATNYETGESIKDFVKGSKYKILQVKVVNKSYSKKSYLLGEINSWVLEQDIEESGVSNSAPVPQPKPVEKTTDQLAQEVIDGKHGSGEERKKSLGSRYNEVQKRVNEILNGKTSKSISELADEVMRGQHGSGRERMISLGSNYTAVQQEVNRRLRK